MNAITVKASAFTAGRVSLRAKSAVAAKPRGMTVMAYKVTLETPEGTQEIECADDTYVLDAAEVRRVGRRTPGSYRVARRSRAREIASGRTRASTSLGWVAILPIASLKPCFRHLDNRRENASRSKTPTGEPR